MRTMRRPAGFVLVGGKSSRMGEDKARLRIEGRALVEIVAKAVEKAAGSVALVGDPARLGDLGYECVADLTAESGPLGGIETALALERAEANLVVACDMPGLRAEDLTRLIAAAGDAEVLCAVARDAAGRRHPLCAVYRRGALGIVRERLQARRLKLQELVEELKAAEVRFDGVLDNLNTPGEYAAWLAEHERVGRG